MTVRRSVPDGDEVTWAIRAELQRVDREIVEVLAKRLELVQRLRTHKRAVGFSLEDRGQERRVLTRARRTATLRGLEAPFVEKILRAAITEGKRTAKRLLRSPRGSHTIGVGSRSRKRR